MPRYVSVPIAAVIVWVVITKGSYRSAEKIFLAAALIYFAYIISGFLAEPDWQAVGEAMVKPQIEFSTPYLMLLIGMIGTTITPWMQFYLQASVVEKGIKIENYKYTKIDVAVGAVIAGLVAFYYSRFRGNAF